jgi:hypothetical protein
MLDPLTDGLTMYDANSEWLYGPDGLASIGTAAAAAAAAAETEAAASGETPCDDGCWFLCTGSANSCFGSPSIFFRLSDASLGLILCCGSTFPSAVYLESTIETLGVSAMSDTSGRPTVISFRMSSIVLGVLVSFEL